MDELNSQFNLLNMKCSEATIHDVQYIVYCHENQYTIDHTIFHVPDIERDYQTIVSTMRVFYPTIINNEFLEILPLIDEYLDHCK